MTDREQVANPQFDFTKPMKWGIGYSKQPSTGPSNTTCHECRFVTEELVPMQSSDGRKARNAHVFFCGKVVEAIGPIKPIKPTTPACSDFKIGGE